jgi:hypothetical protein
LGEQASWSPSGAMISACGMVGGGSAPRSRDAPRPSSEGLEPVFRERAVTRWELLRPRVSLFASEFSLAFRSAW